MRCWLILLILPSFVCCQNERKIDSFYTTKKLGDLKKIPLVKPTRMIYATYDGYWFFSEGLNIYWDGFFTVHNTITIGVKDNFIYGYVKNYNDPLNGFNVTDSMYVSVSGGLTTRLDLGETAPIHINNDSVIIPERWYVIDVEKQEYYGSFSRENYLHRLDSLGIEEKLYDLDSLYKEFQRTDILPWFPEDVKEQLRNRSWLEKQLN